MLNQQNLIISSSGLQELLRKNRKWLDKGFTDSEQLDINNMDSLCYLVTKLSTLEKGAQGYSHTHTNQFMNFINNLILAYHKVDAGIVQLGCGTYVFTDVIILKISKFIYIIPTKLLVFN